MAEEKTFMDMAQDPNGLSTLIFGKPVNDKVPIEQKEEKEKTKGDEKEIEEKKEEKIETPLGNINVETTEDKYKTFIEKTGVNIRSDDDIISYINRAKELEEREAELIREKALGDDFKTFFETAPEKLKKVLVAYASGTDYEAEARNLFNQNIDYNRSWNEQKDKEALIKKMNDISDEDFEEMDERAKTALEKSTERQFESNRNNVITGNRQFLDNQKKIAENINQSIQKSIQKLQERFPKMSKAKVKEVEKKMYSKPFNDMFNEDRTYKEDAAIRIAMQNYGVETIESIQNSVMAKVQAENDKIIKQRVSEELELIAKGRNDTVKGNGSATEGKTAHEKIVESTQWLKPSSSGFRNKNQG